MSEYAEIAIGKMSLACFRNYPDGNIVSLFFSRNDLIITPNCLIDEDIEDSDTYTKYEYKTTVTRAKERLDAQGFSINNLERIFNDHTTQAIDYNPFLHHLRVDYDSYEKVAAKRIKKNVSFKKWQNSMKKIVEFELANGNLTPRPLPKELKITTECDKVISYALRDADAKSFYALRTDIIGMPYVYRLILEYCPNTFEIVLDFSDIQYWDDDCIPKAKEASSYAEKTIVLVEGKSDKDILEFSLKHLYPHLSDLFYFMDFDDAKGGKRNGGTSFMVNSMKTFYFSKIRARFIAVFDNDAEGYSSKCALLKDIKEWPDNFRILLYPSLDQFRKYPTIAPNGSIVKDNINKKAASIELYLPDELIKDKGQFIAIEWESRKRIKQIDGSEEAVYQGVISQKSAIQQNFHRKKNKIDNGKASFNQKEWSKMLELLTTIVFAFNTAQE